MLRLTVLCATGLMLAGCTNQAPPTSADEAAAIETLKEFAPIALHWTAPIMDSDGKNVGEVLFWKADSKGMTLFVDFPGIAPEHRAQLPPNEAIFPAGIHGVHLHEVGKCEGPKFQSAGAHWNPTAHQHGHSNPQGPHVGDLGNITVDQNGRSHSFPVIPKGFGHASGLSLVIHAKADDERTDPSGNSGDRTACAVLIPAPGT